MESQLKSNSGHIANLNLDLLLTLYTHGWSDARFVVDEQLYEFDVTHIFNNPYADAMEALLSVMKGNDDFFILFSEPHGVKISMKCINDKLIEVEIHDINEEIYEVIDTKDTILIVSFVAQTKQFVLLFYYQLKKIAVMLQDKDYAMHRSEDFPFNEFFRFEKQIKAQLSIA